MRTSIEVADIFRAAGPAYRAAHAGHLSLAQLKVMSAIEHCRTAALGGHVEACEDCGQWRIAYNSCRNRHCPKCQFVVWSSCHCDVCDTDGKLWLMRFAKFLIEAMAGVSL